MSLTQLGCCVMLARNSVVSQFESTIGRHIIGKLGGPAGDAHFISRVQESLHPHGDWLLRIGRTTNTHNSCNQRRSNQQSIESGVTMLNLKQTAISFGVLAVAVLVAGAAWQYTRPASYDECMLSEMRGQQ